MQGYKTDPITVYDRETAVSMLGFITSTINVIRNDRSEIDEKELDDALYLITLLQLACIDKL